MKSKNKSVSSISIKIFQIGLRFLVQVHNFLKLMSRLRHPRKDFYCRVNQKDNQAHPVNSKNLANHNGVEAQIEKFHQELQRKMRMKLILNGQILILKKKVILSLVEPLKMKVSLEKPSRRKKRDNKRFGEIERPNTKFKKRNLINLSRWREKMLLKKKLLQLIMNQPNKSK